MATETIHPAGFNLGSVKRIALNTAKVFFDPDTSPRCAATAFFGFLSFFPAIATVALLYGMVVFGFFVFVLVFCFFLVLFFFFFVWLLVAVFRPFLVTDG